MQGVAEEAPGAYKDIHAVVDAADRAGGSSRSSASKADRTADARECLDAACAGASRFRGGVFGTILV